MKTTINNEQQDKKLISESLKKGDIDALRIIYLKHYDEFLKLSISFLKSKTDAEDVLQEAFIKLWDKRHLLKDNQGYDSYLFIILRNTLVNAVRKKSKEILKQDLKSVATIGYSHIENLLEHKELSKNLEKAIDKLPPKRKVVFNLKRNEGLTNQQISDQLGISTQMVEKQLKLARKTIREYMEIHGETSLLSLILFQIIFL